MLGEESSTKTVDEDDLFFYGPVDTQFYGFFDNEFLTPSDFVQDVTEDIAIGDVRIPDYEFESGLRDAQASEIGSRTQYSIPDCCVEESMDALHAMPSAIVTEVAQCDEATMVRAWSHRKSMHDDLSEKIKDPGRTFISAVVSSVARSGC
jgi:hypothetical protein